MSTVEKRWHCMIDWEIKLKDLKQIARAANADVEDAEQELHRARAAYLQATAQHTQQSSS